jgi:methylated-DNA-[protein]-cysteine S-methyltransferase
MAQRTHDIVDSPLGPVALLAEEDRICGLFFVAEHRHAPTEDRWGGRASVARGAGAPGARPLAEAAEQLGDYFAGERTTFDVPLALGGTPFQQQVWTELQQIPYGSTVSYAELADRIGRPTAIRAVGAANGRNPVSILVPCHRVIGTDGSLTGYGGGTPRKQALLTLEASHRDTIWSLAAGSGQQLAE